MMDTTTQALEFFMNAHLECLKAIYAELAKINNTLGRIVEQKQKLGDVDDGSE
jgi:hypothetical protein